MQGKLLPMVAALLCTACSPTAFQMALYNPLQIVDEDTDVQGVRLSLIYGKNATVEGVDVGVVAQSRDAQGLVLAGLHIVDEDFQGIQVSAGAATHGSASGVQASFFLNAARDLEGIQLSTVNLLQESSQAIQAATFANLDKGDLTGVQLALLNHAVRLGGIQLGAVNLAESTDGVQVGAIWNYAEHTASGLQIGLINRADELDGVQIGLLNFCSNGFLPFFPIINFAF